ncbi:DUF986 family protein, partial [Clostridiaceae bacterium HSG29]|nr:DUF986 family protein [Clostridiaceae bacterium HSG29]
IGYIRTIKSGRIISKHRYKIVTKYELIYIIILVIFLTVIVVNIFERGYITTGLLLIYIFILFLTQLKIIVTDNGFYYRGKYVKWSNIVEISIINKDIICLKKLTMIFTDLKIRGLENQEDFLTVGYENYKMNRENL